MKTYRIPRLGFPQQQRGVALVIAGMGLVAIVAVTGLAMDMGHVYVNKTRLQNALDVSALSAAMNIHTGGDTTTATTAARTTFGQNTGTGNAELAAIAPADVIVEFSDGLVPFVNGSGTNYVRVSVTTFSLNSTLVSVLNINNLPVTASAIAGPSPKLAENCNLMPILVCGEDDPLEGGGPPHWGYNPGDVIELKLSPDSKKDDGVCETEQECLGPGNYQLLDVGSGASDIRKALAGSFDACLDVDGNGTTQVDTAPGNKAGPSRQGINTRFGDYSSSPLTIADGRPDKVTDASGSGYPDTHGEYMTDYATPSFDEPVDGEEFRRIVGIPIGECTTGGGVETINIWDSLCFFLDRPVEKNGPDKDKIFGELVVGGCPGSGDPGPGIELGGPFVIQLYKDPDAGDS